MTLSKRRLANCCRRCLWQSQTDRNSDHWKVCGNVQSLDFIRDERLDRHSRGLSFMINHPRHYQVYGCLDPSANQTHGRWKHLAILFRRSHTIAHQRKFWWSCSQFYALWISVLHGDLAQFIQKAHKLAWYKISRNIRLCTGKWSHRSPTALDFIPHTFALSFPSWIIYFLPLAATDMISV